MFYEISWEWAMEWSFQTLAIRIMIDRSSHFATISLHGIIISKRKKNNCNFVSFLLDVKNFKNKKGENMLSGSIYLLCKDVPKNSRVFQTCKSVLTEARLAKCVILSFRNEALFQIKDAFSCWRLLLATESPLKMMKNTYFILKVLFLLRLFKFLS